jgi:hypothetical protein
MAHPCAGVQWARNTTERVGGGCNQRAHNPTAPRREPGKRETWQGSTASTQRAHNTMRGPPLTLFFGWPLADFFGGASENQIAPGGARGYFGPLSGWRQAQGTWRTPRKPWPTCAGVPFWVFSLCSTDLVPSWQNRPTSVQLVEAQALALTLTARPLVKDDQHVPPRAPVDRAPR